MKLKIPGFSNTRGTTFTHEQSLQRLKSLGCAPRVCYDIGAYHGAWTREARRVFPSAEYVLFEANADNRNALDATGERYLLGALGSEDGAPRAFYLPNTDTIATGASLYRENTVHYADDQLRRQTVTLRRLDAVVAEQKLPPPDLIKIDVQGAELDVLAGAPETLKHCNAIIAELSLLTYNTGAPLLAEAITGIDRLGFKCVDLCEVHHTRNGILLQIDLMFVSEAWFDKFRAKAALTG